MKLSVIMPLYNAEEYVAKAIESVLGQKGIEVECIVVDDGSTDKSADVVARYPVQYFVKDNGGASSARNFGLQQATGDYVMFIDADDFISDKSICCQCIDLIDRKKLDFVLFTYQYYNTVTKKYGASINYPQSLEGIYETEALLPQMIRNGLFPASPCFRVLKRDYIMSNKLFFIEGTTSEDVEWYIRLLLASKRFGVINNDAYKYRKGDTASVTGSSSLRKCNNFARMLQLATEATEKCTNPIIQGSVFSGLNYEFSILLANCAQFNRNRELFYDLKKLTSLTKYTDFPRTRIIKIVLNILGIRLTSSLLGWYANRNAKSYK